MPGYTQFMKARVDPPWEEIACQANDIGALAKKSAVMLHVTSPSLNSVLVLWRLTFSYPAMNFSFCTVTAVSDML